MIAAIVSDATQPHEGIPHGVPSGYAWYSSPTVSNALPPATWAAAIPWGVLYVDSTAATTAPNTRVEFGPMEMQTFSTATNQWSVACAGGLIGSWYPEDFIGSAVTSDKRTEPDGNISATAGNGKTFHFFTPNRFPIDPATIGGVFITLSARLIVGDAGQPDDRATAKYLLAAGGDWWIDTSAVSDGTNNTGIGTGRFKYVTSEWQTFHFTTLTEAQLRANPPIGAR